MRIIAGKHRSRKLNTLEGDNTRPTSDRIKEAVFSSLGRIVNEGKVLDLFGGSGNIGLEALSRGMDFAYFCEQNKRAVAIIEENVSLLNEQNKCEIYSGDYKEALEKWKDLKFNLIYMDPPYRLKVIEECLRFIDKHEMLHVYGCIVVESLKEDVFPDKVGSLMKYKEKTYGITRITYYEKGE